MKGQQWVPSDDKLKTFIETCSLPQAITETDAEIFDKLPDPFEIFRGTQGENRVPIMDAIARSR